MVAVVATHAVVGALLVYGLTKSLGPAALFVFAAAVAGIFLVRAGSAWRAALGVYAVALVMSAGWLGMRKLGIVP